MTDAAADDGRHIDRSRGALTGEAAGMSVEVPRHDYPARQEVGRAASEAEGPSYYGLPVLKEPVWVWSIPLYLFVGGTAGATAALGAAAQALDPRGSRALVRHAHRISVIGDVLSAGLLVYDLGRPARFLNMLRVFRPTSPMSVGYWVLTTSGAAGTLAVFPGRKRGLFARIRAFAGYASGLLGLPLAGYTGVLLAGTAVPVWQGGRRALPPLFLASSAASAGALLHLLPVGRHGREAARRFALVGNTAALALGLLFEREVGRVPRAARPLRSGASGVLWSLSRVLTASGLLASVAGRRGGRPAAVLADALALGGALALRVAVFTAGKASARDPLATFHQQRAGAGYGSLRLPAPRSEVTLRAEVDMNTASAPSLADPRTQGVQPPFAGQTQEQPGVEARMQPRPDYGETSYVGHGRLQGRVALVTGGDSGIGRAVALAFAREGADVSIAYLNEHEDAAETRRMVEAAGRACLTIAGDLADASHVERVVDETVRRFGHLDVLVNNAGTQGKALERLEDLSPERVERTFQVNVVAAFALVLRALPHLRPGAAIINVGSIQAYQPKALILDYAATKGALVTFTKGLARELVQRGIRVNCVAPGPVWTPLIQQSFDPEHVAAFGESSPMKRPAQPVEIAPAFVFLACDESRYVNGEILGVTGGELLA